MEQKDMKFSDVEKILQRHDEQIKRLVEELRGIKNALTETELDDIVESEGGGEEYEERKFNQQGTGQQPQWGRQRRGFAAMDPEKRSEIARKGGEASRGGQGKGRSSGEKELEAMEQFLEERGDQLPPQGRREVEEAIEQKREELATRH